MDDYTGHPDVLGEPLPHHLAPEIVEAAQGGHEADIEVTGHEVDEDEGHFHVFSVPYQQPGDVASQGKAEHHVQNWW